MDKKIVNKTRKTTNDELRLEGILSEGYGIIPKKIMKDTDLSIEAKSIYAFLCSYAGKGNTAFPSIETQCYFLNISEKRYLKHRKILIEKNYITIETTREIIEYEDGTCAEVRGKNIYTIVSIPDETFVQDNSRAKNSAQKTKKIHTNTKKRPCKNNKKPCKQVNKPSDLNSQIVSVQNESLQIVSVQNDGTNNNNNKNNSLINNNIKNNTNTTSNKIACSIEENTILKLTPYQIKLVSGWEHRRTLDAIKIFKKENGVYFSLLRKIYYDGNNFKKSSKSFNNFEGRNHSDDYYNELGDILSGLK